MILGLGIDLVDVPAFRGLVGDRFVEATFTAGELAYAKTAPGDPIDHLAARFAAKEAALKALDAAAALVGVNPPAVPLADVEVRRDARGRPSLGFTGAARTLVDALEIQRAHVSLTHDGPGAAAVVVLER